MTDFCIDKLTFNSDGLIPAIIQEEESQRVLMLGYMNSEAIQKTLSTGEVYFFSRKRQVLWHKGERSGNIFYVQKIQRDCDQDVLLIQIKNVRNACHKNRHSCFSETFDPETGWTATPDDREIISRLVEIIEQRKRQCSEEDRPQKPSYVRSLLDGGGGLIGGKVVEEAQEYREALEEGDFKQVIHESADVFFHLLVGLSLQKIGLIDLKRELERRFGVSGIEEKAHRKP